MRKLSNSVFPGDNMSCSGFYFYTDCFAVNNNVVKVCCCVTAGCAAWWMLGIQRQRGILGRAVVSCHHSDWSINRTYPSLTGSFRQYQQCSTQLHSLGQSLPVSAFNAVRIFINSNNVQGWLHRRQLNLWVNWLQFIFNLRLNGYLYCIKHSEWQIANAYDVTRLRW